MADSLPTEFVQRPDEFNELVRLLLAQNRESPVAITAALSGAGGYGKTLMATAICHDQRIRNVFKDGILWVTLGESASQLKLIDEIAILSRKLSGERESFTGLNEATNRLIELLGDRDLLLVIDDVWNLDHARPFLRGGPRCARLITTRNLDTLPSNAQQVKVDAMRPAEAIEMLRAGLPAAEIQRRDRAGTDEALRRLATRMGEWPLLLGLVNGALHDRVNHANQPLPDAIAYINRALDKRGLTFFDARDTESRSQAVARTLGVSLELLKPAERARYAELAVFPEDVNVPLTTLEKFWGGTGATDGFDAEFDTEVLCARLNQFSLLHSFDLGARTIRLHDVIRTFLRDERKNDLPALNNQLLDAHRPDTGWADMPNDDRYLWDHLASHLIEAGCGEELVATVKDWRYLARKIFLRKAHAVENDLIEAEKIAPADDPLRMLRRGISGSSHLINHCDNKRDIESTMLARLHHLTDLTAMVQDLAQNLTRPYVTPHSGLPDQPHPALIRTLEGHSSPVNGCAFSPDGRLIVSASDDRTLKVWDAQSGQLLRSLDGHSNSVRGCAISPDGRLIVSASDDHTLKVWDAQSGQILRSLDGHSDSVRGCAFSPDGGLIVSASWDNTLKVWDAQSGQLLRSLDGHSISVYGCAISPDGKLIVSASDDCTLKVWDAQSGQLLRSLEDHSNSVNACAISPDGRLIVSASSDRTLKVWDARTGQLLRSLDGHSDYVIGCAFSPDGRLIISASWDNTLKVWDAQSGQMLRSLDGHSYYVNGCAFSPDGRLIVSASTDCTLKVWEAQSEQLSRSLEGHSSPVSGCAFSPDGRLIVSASDDRTLKVWDAQSGQLLRSLDGHSNSVRGCAISPDGRLIVSASSDRTLKVWDAQSGQLLRSLDGHSKSVNGCAFSPDGRLIVSASSDRTLKVWDAQSGQMLHSLDGHSYYVYGCAFSPDGKLIVSASSDRTLRVWEAQSGRLLRSLDGHSDYVIGCAFSPDGRLIVSASSDRTLKVWDAQSGQMLRSLDGHSAYVNGCAFSPDGKLIVSASDDYTLKVWEAQSGQAMATFFADGPMNCCVVYGEMITGGGERGVYLLRLVR
jgi:WD40 repeat protein